MGLDSGLDLTRILALPVQLAHSLSVHLDVPIDHHLFEEHEVFDGHDLLEQALVDTFVGPRLGHDKVGLRDAQVLNVRLKFGLD